MNLNKIFIKNIRFSIICCFLLIGETTVLFAQKKFQVLPFGENGSIKMLYDRRQRPQSVFLDGKVHIAFAGDAEFSNSKRAKTKPQIVTFDPQTRTFSQIVTLGPANSDHHFTPVIWSDNNKKLHVLYGCHKTPGTHLISKKAGNIGVGLEDWIEGPTIAPSISYPTFYRVIEGKELMYYRTSGHISSWTYRISDDNGENWRGPEKDVTDLNSKGRFEWSSYQCKLPSKDGRYLHVVFMAYDDNRNRDPDRYYNPRYNKAVTNEWKYNLYYVKIDLLTDIVTNFKDLKLITPIDLDQANAKCRIWDTEGRGAGVPPDIVIDDNGNPAFLHVLSEETTENHNYYFVHQQNGQWQSKVIAPSNHQWNSCHVQLDDDGVYHAFLVAGDEYVRTNWVEGKERGENAGYLKTGGFMDRHGGGRIEEWISSNEGKTWERYRDLTPSKKEYTGWKYNNIQPVTNPDGSVVDGMIMFYGWKDKDAPDAKAFLVIDDN